MNSPIPSIANARFSDPSPLTMVDVTPLHDAAEERRLRTLNMMRLLDTETEKSFDRIVDLAADLFNVPIALVSLVDRKRQWFKARCGLDAQETHQDLAFCHYAITHDGVMVVEDAREDIRFRDNPLVAGDPFIRFYAGAPLIASDGHALGTLCVIDRAPRRFDDHDCARLADLAATVAVLIEKRFAVQAAEDLRVAAEKAIAEREASVLALIKTLSEPVNGVLGYADLLNSAAYGSLGDERYREAAAALSDCARDLADRIDAAASSAATCADKGDDAVSPQPMRVDEAAHMVVAYLNDRGARRGVTLRLGDDPPKFEIEADFALTRHMLVNVTLSAIQRAQPGSTVTLSVSPRAERACVKVDYCDPRADGVPTIAELQLQAVEQLAGRLGGRLEIGTNDLEQIRLSLAL